MQFLRPLRERDFALLWAGSTVSMVGDGIFLVALPFAVLDRSNSAATLSLVGVAWSLGTVAFLLIGGVLADRVDKRHVLIGADLVRVVALAAGAALAISDALAVWHLVVLGAFYGVGEGLAAPAMGAIVPDLVPNAELLQANALSHSARPLAFRLAGPALGGLIVTGLGTSAALLIDAATFLASLACVVAIRTRPNIRHVVGPPRGQLREALGFVRSQRWLWVTLLAAAVALLAYMGPVEVLVPIRVKEELGSTASAFGLVLAANGAGTAIGSIAIANFGAPRDKISFLYWTWGMSSIGLMGYGLADAIWQLVAFAMIYGLFVGCGVPVWATLMQVAVPAHIRGRVGSMDWLVSIGLTPVSFALTGPIAAAAGAQATLVGAGVISVATTIGLLYAVPGLRERHGYVEPATSDARSSVKVG